MSKKFVALFLVVQLLVPSTLLGLRTAREGWWPNENYRYGWQVYSAVSDAQLCKLRSICE